MPRSPARSRDATGAGLPEVAVTIRNLETGAERKLVSDDGRPLRRAVDRGRPLSRSGGEGGLRSQVRTGIDLVVGQSTTVDITLPVGELQRVRDSGRGALAGEALHAADLRPGERTASERPAAERPQLRRTDDAQSGDRELHVGAVRRRWDVELLGGQHVRRIRTPAAGQSVPVERH